MKIARTKSPAQVEVFLQLSGVDFNAADRGAVKGRYGAVPVRCIGLDDLPANERAAGRPKDLVDGAALEGELKSSVIGVHYGLRPTRL